MTSDLRPIRLELAREPGSPAGERRCGYGIVAPLDAAGRFDPGAARTMETSRRVRRFADEETGFRFGEACFMPGEYVSLQAPDGATHACQVGQSRAL